MVWGLCEYYPIRTGTVPPRMIPLIVLEFSPYSTAESRWTFCIYSLSLSRGMKGCRGVPMAIQPSCGQRVYSVCPPGVNEAMFDLSTEKHWTWNAVKNSMKHQKVSNPSQLADFYVFLRRHCGPWLSRVAILDLHPPPSVLAWLLWRIQGIFTRSVICGSRAWPWERVKYFVHIRNSKS
jgi:hypothetical protein